MKLVKKLKIKNCRLKFSKSNCFMYDFEKLGVTEKELQEFFEDAMLLVYKNENVKLSKSLRKCIYCDIKTDNMKRHLAKKHNVPPSFIIRAKFQLKLYKKLLDLQRKKSTIYALVFTPNGCALCIEPVKEGREGLCALPESARNKVRGLTQLGFKCTDFEDKWKYNDRYGFIIVKHMQKGISNIPNR